MNNKINNAKKSKNIHLVKNRKLRYIQFLIYQNEWTQNVSNM